ncbi:SGNH/GDSL hydrolase family protein [Olleya aquimaris]|uniref:GDSL-like lipase/acylhydrolase family protein n=1 Tax=Olleya aquimaris TaxID=639310 RepID=A0A327R5L7_9FLAO|nr:G-D-S-L family lipolytic protein [Olleya aquimaris]RAJ12136.1 GDSL-like lipase/acylhydrolase family protein [Olleya aquimaris]
MKTFKNIKYIGLLAIAISFTACNDEEDFEQFLDMPPADAVALPAPTSGSADFSTFVSLGNSLTAGFADGALYSIAQENSTPNIMASKFSLVGGGNFTQPLMNDNVGGLLAGGSPLPGFGPRLVFDGAGPVPITNLNPGAMTTTDIVLNNPTGPFNNMGVPGAKSFHLLAPGYGDLNGLFTVPATANPYFVRMASSSTTSVIADAMAQAPTFFSLWIGNNDVLGYALSGGDGTNPITPTATFDFAYSTLITTLTSGGAKGVVANIPDVTAIPHFTTVPYNPIPLDAATASALNQGYATYNGGLQFAMSNGLITQAEVDKRTIAFAEGSNNAMVLIDEDLTDLTSFGIPSYRQSTADDLFVLPLSSLIPQGYGTQIPLADKWALTPEEQAEIATATASFNATIQSQASAANLAFVDANALLNLVKDGNLPSGNYNLTSDLVTGGAFSLDGVHPTSRGYALIANQFLKAIDLKYGSNFEASGNLVDIGEYNTNYSAGLQ